MLKKYYQQTLYELRHQGAAFAKHYPALARYLGMYHTDPDIERLFEAFAFVTAKLERRLDILYPELTSQLLSLIYPCGVMVQPAATVLDYADKVNLSTEPLTFMAKEQRYYLQAMKPVFEDNVPCYIHKSDVSTTAKMIELTWQLTRLSNRLAHSRSVRIQIFPVADNATSANWFYLFCHMKTTCQIMAEGKFYQVQTRILPIGLQHYLLEPWVTTTAPWHALHELMTFPQKLYALAIEWVDLPDELLQAKTWQISWRFPQERVVENNLTAVRFIANGALAINVFPIDLRPITTQLGECDYALHADTLPLDAATEVWQLDEITRWDHALHHSTVLTSIAATGVGAKTDFMTVWRQEGNARLPQLRLLLTNSVTKDSDVLSMHGYGIQPEITSHLTAGTSAVGQSDICIAMPLSKTDLFYRDGSHWQLLTLLSAQMPAFLNESTLNQLLQLMETSSPYWRYFCEGGIHHWTMTKTPMRCGSALVMAQRITVEVNCEVFSSIGEAYMLCAVLAKMCQAFSPITEYVAFHAYVKKINQVWRWPNT